MQRALTWFVFRQQYNGLPVDKNEFTVTFNAAGKVGFINSSIPVKIFFFSITPSLKKMQPLKK